MAWYGSFEFVNGGWEMHEDSCPHYADMLHNIFKGHQFLYNEFWIFPRVAWSLDMYGHSSTNARLYAESGIEAMFIKNVDPEERKQRLANSSMEFIWRPQFLNLGRKAELFTHLFYDFDTSPFDLVVEDVYFNGTGQMIDPEEYEYYWGNKSHDWWWDDDMYDDVTDTDDDEWDDEDDWNWEDDDDWWYDDDFNSTKTTVKKGLLNKMFKKRQMKEM